MHVAELEDERGPGMQPISKQAVKLEVHLSTSLLSHFSEGPIGAAWEDGGQERPEDKREWE